jgi:Spy/CpxP family protein refolding chaperone
MRTALRFGGTLLAAALLVAAPANAQAQGGGRGRGERREQVLRRRLALTDSQVVRLRATTRSYAPRRLALARRESALADSLRAQLALPTRAEPVISGLLDRLLTVRRERFELRMTEQRARAAFLTPSQRALLLGFEEQAQRRAAAVRAERRGRRGAP